MIAGRDLQGAGKKIVPLFRRSYMADGGEHVRMLPGDALLERILDGVGIDDATV